MKGILLAGGTGSRLHPLTRGINKHLIPVYNKPLIYYPLSTLMLAGIREIALVTSPHHIPQFQAMLGDGRHWGLSLEYIPQPQPGGTGQAMLLGQAFVGTSPFALILGDNIFHGEGLPLILQQASRLERGGLMMGYHVSDPRPYGVVTFDPMERVVEIEEKPQNPKSNWAVTGLFFYESAVMEMTAGLPCSPRGELEITDLNLKLMARGELSLKLLGRGNAWFDAGAHDALLEAANYISSVERRQGQMIACPEEIAYRMGYISVDQLLALAHEMPDNGYRQYLLQRFQSPGLR